MIHVTSCLDNLQPQSASPTWSHLQSLPTAGLVQRHKFNKGPVLSTSLLAKAIRRSISSQHYLSRAAGPSELSVVLCSDAHIARLNGEWRQKAEATDVLSFPMEQDSGDGCPVRMLGDLIISLDTAQRQADERG